MRIGAIFAHYVIKPALDCESRTLSLTIYSKEHWTIHIVRFSYLLLQRNLHVLVVDFIVQLLIYIH
jgi:hypothetical protein